MESGRGIIRAIEKTSVHRICSGQVILELATAVKELVENSLDAGATSIEIKLKEYGAESIEVADNGCGVSPENYQALTLKYHTSKISKFSDLQSLSSFGFRGEALSSLCALGNVSIVTRTKNEPVAAHLKYDHSGLLVSQENEARPIGTTVIVSKLFSTLPVRHKEFSRNVRREYSRLISTLHAYALIAKGVRFVCTHLSGKSNKSVILKTQGTSFMKDNIITVFGIKTAACLKPVDLPLSDGCMIEGFMSKPGAGCGRPCGDRQFFYINGRPVDMPKVAKLLNELYKSFNSQQYPMCILNFILPTTVYDVNVTPDKRKVFLHSENDLISRLRECLEEIYAPNKYVYAVNKIANSTLEKDTSGIELIEFETQKSLIDEDEDIDTVDALETDSRAGEENFCEKIGTENNKDESDRSQKIHFDRIETFIEEKRATETIAFPADLNSFQCASHLATTRFSGTSTNSGGSLNSGTHSRKNISSSTHQKAVQSKLTSFVNQTEKQSEDEALLTEEPLLKKWTFSSVDHNGRKNYGTDAKIGMHHAITGLLKPHRDQASLCCSKITKVPPELDEEAIPGGFKKLPEKECGDYSTEGEIAINKEKADDYSNKSHIPPNNSSMGSADKEDSRNDFLKAYFNLEKLQSRIKAGVLSYEDNYGASKRTNNLKRKRCFTAATMPLGGIIEEGSEKEAALAAATRELERTFNKSDFKRMKVLGQFNLGFIVAKLDDDLFILDQHASDEKYNFERLSKSTVLKRQPLLRPLPLELSAAEEITVSTHIEVFRQNGFDFVECMEDPSSHRLCLSAVPFSNNITFGVEDVQELVSLLADGPVSNQYEGSKVPCDNSVEMKEKSCTSPSIRPSRVRSMLASRACRSSIMIGDALSKKEMEKVVLHLADLDAPWNCPHGRPTMRHLVDLTDLLKC